MTGWKLNVFIFIVSVAFGIFLYKVIYPPFSITESNSDPNIISGKFDEAKLKTNNEWKKVLTPEQFYILREAGTEVPFSGGLDKEYRRGTYYSVGCDNPLFRSEQKYDSGTGWPSFTAPISNDSLVLRKQLTVVGFQTEVLDKCGNHLGHVFDDGPAPTGKRYCMNSIALRFVPDK